MRGVGRTGVELRQAQIQVWCAVVLAVDEECTDADDLGRRSHPTLCIDHKSPAEVGAPAGKIDAKTMQWSATSCAACSKCREASSRSMLLRVVSEIDMTVELP
jgi:hypothetical protein